MQPLEKSDAFLPHDTSGQVTVIGSALVSSISKCVQAQAWDWGIGH